MFCSEKIILKYNPCLKKCVDTFCTCNNYLPHIPVKENSLKTSIFSSSHNVFYHIKIWNHQFSGIKIVVCKFFQFVQGLNFVISKQFLDQSKMEACTEDKINLTANSKFVLGRVGLKTL